MMTNGTVKGAVTAASGRELTIGFKDSSNTVYVPPSAPVVTFAPATRDDLKPGAPVFVVDRMTLTLFNLGSCFPLARGFEFALGMAASLLWQRWIVPVELSPRAWTAIEGAALGATALWLVLAVPALVGAFEGPLFVWLRASGSCWVFAMLIIAMAGGRGAFSRALALRPFVALGEASFAFYMVHMIAMRALRFYLGPGPGALSALAISLSLAFLLHEALEKPMRRRLLAAAAPRRLAPIADSPQP